MITHLSIQGLAIIDTLQIDFASGFNVITGETGAGKSILIRALNFLTGGKASADAVRSGWEAATVSGEFVVPREHRVLKVLEQFGISVEKGASIGLLLRRQLHAKGRSQAWVNDTPVTLPSLRAIGSTLVDVFAQHENQRLLNPHEHIDYVDSFLDDPKLRESVRVLGKSCNEKVQALATTLRGFEDKKRQSDYLSFRAEELRRFDPSLEDYQAIRDFCQNAEAFRKTRDPLAQAMALLEGTEGAEAPSQIVREAAKILAQPSTPAGANLPALRERVLACASELDDVSYELGRLLSGMEFDEEKLEQSQERLYGYQELFRKHSVREIEALVAQLETLESELSLLGSIEKKLAQDLAALTDSAQQLKQACERLSVARMQAADSIKNEVEQELNDLHMPGSVFQAEFSVLDRELPVIDWAGFDDGLSRQWEKAGKLLKGVSDQGSEKAQFFLSANPGEPPLPLSRVASGGELSRIMLALKNALAADAETCVLVFDEIDSGISGRVADVVGKKMRSLSSGVQVLCISHLPQVAVYADAHFLVTKKGKGERTQSSIVPLSKEESAREIARLLSGREVSSSSLANAKNLIVAAQSTRRKTKAKPSLHP